MIKTKIATLLDDYGDGIHGTPVYSDTGEYYFINGNNLNDGRIQITNDTLKIDVSEYLRIKRPLNENTLLMSINGTLGKIALYRGEKIALGKSACFLNATSTINRDFIRWVLSTTAFRQYMMQVSHGSTIKNLAPSQIAEYEFQDVQDKEHVVHLLNSLDNKIDLNNRICAEMEAMAKTLYDYWFVQFDFPDENGKPYRTSGGAMEWCQELGREVPKGWKSYKLGDISTFKNGINYEKAAIGDKEYRIINVRDISSSTLLIDEHRLDNISLPQKQADKYLVSIDDIIIARSGTPGATRLLVRSVYPTIFCGFIICCTPLKDIYKYYLLHLLKKYEGTSATKTGGSILQNVSQETLKSIGVILPQEETMIRFNKNVIPYYRKEQQLIEENYELETLRDWLLPMLMNGQVKIRKMLNKY